MGCRHFLSVGNPGCGVVGGWTPAEHAGSPHSTVREDGASTGQPVADSALLRRERPVRFPRDELCRGDGKRDDVPVRPGRHPICVGSLTALGLGSYFGRCPRDPDRWSDGVDGGDRRFRYRPLLRLLEILCSLSFSLADSNSEEARISSDEEIAKQVQEELVGSPDLTEEKMVAGI